MTIYSFLNDVYLYAEANKNENQSEEYHFALDIQYRKITM